MSFAEIRSRHRGLFLPALASPAATHVDARAAQRGVVELGPRLESGLIAELGSQQSRGRLAQALLEARECRGVEVDQARIGFLLAQEHRTGANGHIGAPQPTQRPCLRESAKAGDVVWIED